MDRFDLSVEFKESYSNMISLMKLKPSSTKSTIKVILVAFIIIKIYYYYELYMCADNRSSQIRKNIQIWKLYLRVREEINRAV